MTTAPLGGKVALVTGASRGVGRGVALGLGEAGATVYVTGRTLRGRHPEMPFLSGCLEETAAEVTALGGQGIPLVCDHRDDGQTQVVLETIRGEHGHLDILVNNVWGGTRACTAGTSAGRAGVRRSGNSPSHCGTRCSGLGCGRTTSRPRSPRRS